MSKHIADLEAIKGYTSRTGLFSSFGKGTNKILMGCVIYSENKIYYEVINNGKVVAVKDSLESAIDEYNSL